jgi:hypothetical protein
MRSEPAGTVSAKVFEPVIWKSKLVVVWYQRRSRASSQTVGNVCTFDRFAHASVNHRSVGLIPTNLWGTSCGSQHNMRASEKVWRTTIHVTIAARMEIATIMNKAFSAQ